MMRGFVRKPLRMALFYGLVPPAAGVLAMAATYQPAIRNLGAFASDAFLFVAIAAYVIAAPPLALAGWLVGMSAAKGRSLPGLVLLSGGLGFFLVAVATGLWSFFGLITGGWIVVLALAVAGGIAGLIAALIAGLLSAAGASPRSA
jgi:hypothetical protein